MSLRAKQDARKLNPDGPRAFSLFEQLGNSNQPDKVKERYAHALEIIKAETTGLFTKKQGFDIKRFESWSEAKRRKIRRYYNDIITLQSYGVRIKQSMPRDKSKRAKAQKAAQHPRVIKSLKYLYVPSTVKYKTKIKFTGKGEAYRSDKYFDIFAYYFNLQNLISDDDEIVRGECFHAYKQIQKSAGKKVLRFITIMTGDFESFRIGNRIKGPEDLYREISRMQMKYQSSEHLWTEWLRGILGYFSRKDSDPYLASGSRSSMHLNDIEEKRLLRKKIMRADPEARAMYQRREERELGAAMKLSKAMQRMIALEELKTQMVSAGLDLNQYNRLKSELATEIKDLERQVIGRQMKNKRG